MNELDVTVRYLPPMTVVAAHAFGARPEDEAWSRLSAWAGSLGLLDDPTAYPVFGFDNPPPREGRAEYGYEFWIRVDPGTVPGPDLEVKEVPGGSYVVTMCRLFGDPRGPVADIWRMLWQWAADRRFRWRDTHELERLVNPGVPDDEIVLELLLPVHDRALDGERVN